MGNRIKPEPGKPDTVCNDEIIPVKAACLVEDHHMRKGNTGTKTVTDQREQEIMIRFKYGTNIIGLLKRYFFGLCLARAGFCNKRDIAVRTPVQIFGKIIITVSGNIITGLYLLSRRFFCGFFGLQLFCGRLFSLVRIFLVFVRHNEKVLGRDAISTLGLVLEKKGGDRSPFRCERKNWR